MSLASLAGYDLSGDRKVAAAGRTDRIRATLGVGARAGFERSSADVSLGVTSHRDNGGQSGFQLDFSRVNQDPVSPDRVMLSQRSRDSFAPPRDGLFTARDDSYSVMSESTVGFGTTRRDDGGSSIGIGDKLKQLRGFIQGLAVQHRNKIIPDFKERLSLAHDELIRRCRRRLLVTRFKRAQAEIGSYRDGANGETDSRPGLRDGFGNLLTDRAVGRRGTGVADALRGDRDRDRKRGGRHGGAPSPARGSAARALRRRAKRAQALDAAEVSAARREEYSIGLEAFTMALTAMHAPGRPGITPTEAQLLWNRCRGNYLTFANNLFAESDAAVEAATMGSRARQRVPGLPLGKGGRTGTMGKPRSKKPPSAYSMEAQLQPLVQHGLFDPHGGGERSLVTPAASTIPQRIRYRHSKTPVRPPTGWSPSDIPRSASLPDAALEIEHIYGYNSRESGGQNLHWTQGGNLAYFNAGVAVVLDPIGNTQRFYTGHDDDVTCLAIDRVGRMAATGQTGARPFIAVWDMMSDGTATGCDEIARLGWVKEVVTNPRPGQQAWAWRCWYESSICAVAFTSDSRRVIGVGGDENHSVGIWDIGTGLLLAKNVCCKGIPPQVYDVVVGKLPSQPSGTDYFITVGPSKHIKFWTIEPVTSRGATASDALKLTARAGTFYPETPPRGLLCAEFLPSFDNVRSARGLAVVGSDSGGIWIFDVLSGKALKMYAGHGKSAVTSIALAPGGFVSGGSDGKLKRWRVDEVSEDLQAEYDEAMEDYNAAKAAAAAAEAGAAEGGAETNAAMLQIPDRPAPPISATRVWNVRRWYRKQQKELAGDDLSEMGKVFRHNAKAKRTFKTKVRSKSRLRFDSQEYAPGGEAAEKKRSKSRSAATAASSAASSKYGRPPPLNVRSICVRLMTDAGDDAAGGFTGDELEDEADEELLHGAPVDKSTISASTPITLCFGSSISSVYILGDSPPEPDSDESEDEEEEDGPKTLNMEEEFRRMMDDSQPLQICAGHHGTVYGLCPHPRRLGIFATVGEDFRICVWDGRKRQLKRNRYIADKGRSVAWSPDGAHIAIGCVRGNWIVVSSTTLDELYREQHCREIIGDIRYSPDGRFLAVASHDQYIDLYLCGRGYQHCHRLKGHSAYITHIDWSIDSRILMSNCGGYESILWDAGSGKIIRSLHDSTDADTTWHTWTCILGFPVMGIWPLASDGTDVNAVHRTRDGKFVVTADDNGLVKLFNCPAVVHDAPHRAYRAHASHVMNVRFLKEDTHVVSAGGADRSVVQWKFVTRTIQDHEDVFHSDREVFDPLGNRRHWKGSKPWM